MPAAGECLSNAGGLTIAGVRKRLGQREPAWAATPAPVLVTHEDQSDLWLWPWHSDPWGMGGGGSGGSGGGVSLNLQGKLILE